MLTDYGTFCYWRMLKLHFTTKSYDVVDSQWRVRGISKEHYSNQVSGKKSVYAYVAKKYETPKNFIKNVIANLTNNSGIFVHDLLDSKSDGNFSEWSNRINSLVNHSENNIEYLLDSYPHKDDFIQIFDSSSYDCPLFLKMLNRKYITPEFFCLVLHESGIKGFPAQWDKDLAHLPFWNELHLRLNKYRKLLYITKKGEYTTVKKKYHELLINQYQFTQLELKKYKLIS